MACDARFIASVCEALSPLGAVRFRKMMGDYVIYLDEKCVATACDNLLYVKMLPCLGDVMRNAETGKPYEGAKDCYVLDISDESFARRVVSLLWENLPFPKRKAKG
ncbi:MAG: TfoX/Sxy family protein [Prevotellaceae bacterium]|nr:TfoX/Sxy family protein [Prevotellaceae bacterium]